MFLTKYCVQRSCLFKNSLRNATISAVHMGFQENKRIQYLHPGVIRQWQCETRSYSVSSLFSLHRKWYSKGLPDPANYSDIDLKKIRSIFPEPRMTLNNLSAKTPEKVFDVHYKQLAAPKAAKKKATQNLDWTCCYNFVWPEKMKFECTALSKRQAGEAAATQALHWLLSNKKIDTKGHPMYDRETINEVRSALNEPIRASISEKAAERVERIWEDYHSGISVIYERTRNDAQHKIVSAVWIAKESTMDEDDFSDGENASEEITDITDGPVHPVYGRPLRPPTEIALRRRREALQRSFEYYDETITPLPIDDYSAQITTAVQNNPVTIIVGAAGCGKSTRVPAMLVRGGAAIAVAEPRRVAATGLSERVASELGEEVGVTVGYQVRLDSKPPRPPTGSILFCTSGILLNRLQTNPGLTGCTHVIIDEAHERDINTDISLLLLKRALKLNPELKVVVMSATLDTGVFTRYFGACPIIEVPGRTHPVEVTYLEDIQENFKIHLPNTLANCRKEDGKPQLNVAEIVETIKAVDKQGEPGAILVFLPGWAEIKLAKQALDRCLGQSGVHVILPVHSRLSTAEQCKMFAAPPPGVRKVVLATNVAETSVTIPDVLHVVDAGATREAALREGTGTSSLETVWVSLAAAKQRCGRAGRVQPGHCYRLYTKEKEAGFEPHTTPEILRVPLEQTVLDCKSYAPDDKAQDFLSELPEPPSDKAVEFAVNDLIDIGALTPKEQLTRLGKALSKLQLSPRLGLSLVHAWALGTAVAASDIAASGDVEVFLNAADRREEIREIKRRFSATSDHFAMHRLQQEFEEKARSSNRSLESWCQLHQIRKERLGFVKSLSSLYLGQLLKTGLVEPTLELEEMSRFSGIEQLVTGALLSAADGLLYSKRTVRTKGKLKAVHEVFSSTGERAHIASESVNRSITKRATASLLVHTGARHSAERRALLVYRSSAVTPLAPLLFCRGHIVTKELDEETTVLSLRRHKLDIHVPSSQAETVLRARSMLWSTLQYYIDRDLKALDYDEHTLISRFKIRLVKAVGRILVEGHRECFEGKRLDIEQLDDL